MNSSHVSTRNLVIVIPARRNSKSVPFKNRYKINNLTIVDHAINFAKELKPSEIILSTDDEYYLDDSKYNDFALKRPKEYATDNAIISDVLLDLVESKKLENKFLLVCEPTSLPRDKNHLLPLFDGTFIQSGRKSLASFTKSPYIKQKVWLSKNNKLIPDPDIWKRRQDYEPQYILTGHYYGFWGRDLKSYHPGLCDENVFPIFINEKYFDINTIEELKEAEEFLTK